MKTTPIIFNADMVRALLAGTKSQTRRVVHPCPARIENREEPGASWHQWRWRQHPFTTQDFGAVVSACPYGKPGDLLYVKETWAEDSDEYGSPIIAYKAGGAEMIGRLDDGRDYLIQGATFGEWCAPEKWRSSRFMFRWASRLTLRLTDVRVQRVQDISASDCRAEGHPTEWGRSIDLRVHDDAARDWFMDLWNSINAKRGYGWDANPWVWALSFDVLHANVDTVLTQEAA